MKLPNPERAIVEVDKISGYCLNPEHPQGKHKARVFKSALNLNLENAEELQIALLQAVTNWDAVLAIGCRLNNKQFMNVYYFVQ
ncbi:DUF6883 domain-containing protein [Calothrix sp. PCC 6303]|uniref:DUF6883 domain-containing protein n=1 Tax=Calothrix sp. PCC 6303 TaxID=1170562 RepID=UPI0002A00B52|nr:DUF6883 domain-containing protein [Calothrix sp. PCC 6303]AFZ03157.1 hypothetical protein Cal6303_4248 [Calothrix sp. PCC 6303]